LVKQNEIDMTTSIKYGKMVTVITEVNNQGVIKTYNKTNFLNLLPSIESFEMVIGVNIKSVIKKIESLGFNVLVNDSWGFDWEVKLTCAK
jgi:translation initiation factor 6 (eIF-6)